MSMNYRLADMLTQIRNAQAARLAEVRLPASKFLGSVVEVLISEGYVDSYTQEEISKGRNQLVVKLKYHEGERVIKQIDCISKPGRRVYCEISKLPKYYNGLGIAILSTSKGVMSDFQARQANVGGEVLCSVF